MEIIIVYGVPVTQTLKYMTCPQTNGLLYSDWDGVFTYELIILSYWLIILSY